MNTPDEYGKNNPNKAGETHIRWRRGATNAPTPALCVDVATNPAPCVDAANKQATKKRRQTGKKRVTSIKQTPVSLSSNREGTPEVQGKGDRPTSKQPINASSNQEEKDYQPNTTRPNNQPGRHDMGPEDRQVTI